MIDFKKWLIPLVLLTPGFLQAAQEKVNKKKRKAHIDQKAEVEEQPKRVRESNEIPICIENLRGKQEFIKFNDIESISGETFGELIEKRKQRGDLFIIARVRTFNKDLSQNVNYYDSYYFNQWRFGEYPLFDRDISVVHGKDPNNNLDIETAAGDIEYFSYDPLQPHQGFGWLCSERNFIDFKLYRLIIEASQSFDPVLRAKAYIQLGFIYYDYNRALNKKDSLKYFEKAANQNDDLLTKMESTYTLGSLYYAGGKDIAKDWNKAKLYLDVVSNQSEYPNIKAEADLRLGEMYVFGTNGIEKNSHEARKYLESAVAQEVTVFRAKATLGQLYYFGAKDVSQDWVKAKKYFEAVSDQDKSSQSKLIGNRYLGSIYFYGGHGVDQNYDQARRYLEVVADQTDNVPMSEYAKKKLEELDKLQSASASSSSS